MSTAAVTEELERLLATTYLLGIKTHGCHWNVVGPHFAPLHALFGEQYEALFEAADELAERIRALGAKAPVGLARWGAASDVAVEPTDAELPAAAMIAALRDGHRAAAARAKAVIAAAEAADDHATADLAVERVDAHDKAAWMLDAHLQG